MILKFLKAMVYAYKSPREKRQWLVALEAPEGWLELKSHPLQVVMYNCYIDFLYALCLEPMMLPYMCMIEKVISGLWGWVLLY